MRRDSLEDYCSAFSRDQQRNWPGLDSGSDHLQSGEKHSLLGLMGTHLSWVPGSLLSPT